MSMRSGLGIDFGSSNTVAMLRREDGSVTPLLFDSSPLLASAVCIDTGGLLLTGADAERAGAAQPEGYEPNPKRRIDDGTVWLGQREVPADELIGAVLARVATEARRVSGSSSSIDVTLTHPASWGRSRLDVLTNAARRAGLTEVSLVPEPVAAAAYFAAELNRQLPPDRCVVVYDLGAGTFDVSVVRPAEGAFEVLATDGLPDVGGLDLDATVVAHARSLTAGAAAWGRLDWPETVADQRARRLLWQGARATKEQLSRHVSAPLHVPLVERDFHLTRDEFEAAARPHLDRTVELTRATLRSAGVAREQIEGLFLVGGSSRVPLVATLLRRELGIPPTVIDQPELVVARGGLYARPPQAALAASTPTPASAYAPTAVPAPAAAPPSAAAAPSGPAPGRPPAPGLVTTPPVPPTKIGPGVLRRPWIWIGAAGLILAVLLGTRVLLDSPPERGGSPTAGGLTSSVTGGRNVGNSSGQGGSGVTVAYQVTGEGAVNIIYTDEGGAPKPAGVVSLPWQKQVKVPNGARAELHAVRTAGRATGELFCRITVNGQDKDYKRSGAANGVVNCATSLDG